MIITIILQRLGPHFIISWRSYYYIFWQEPGSCNAYIYNVHMLFEYLYAWWNSICMHVCICACMCPQIYMLVLSADDYGACSLADISFFELSSSFVSLISWKMDPLCIEYPLHSRHIHSLKCMHVSQIIHI